MTAEYLENSFRILTRILVRNLANKSDDREIFQDFDRNSFRIAAVANPVDHKICYNSGWFSVKLADSV